MTFIRLNRLLREAGLSGQDNFLVQASVVTAQHEQSSVNNDGGVCRARSGTMRAVKRLSLRMPDCDQISARRDAGICTSRWLRWQSTTSSRPRRGD